MSCVDAAIIQELNKQKTDNAESISTNSINCNGKITAVNVYTGSLDIEHMGMYWSTASNCLMAYNRITDRYTSIGGGSQTITHYTNVSGEIGTFCEATGEIYDGYEKIDNTDCICKVRSASALSSSIVGIITRDNEFASHGDALVKVVPGSYNIGDILVPDASGFARKATDEELVYMMTHAIPRPKITSLDTGIDGMVACFLI